MPSSNSLLASKIIVIEEPPSVKTIQGVPTSITGFLGITEYGPIGVPQFCTSFEEYVQTFGSYISASYLTAAVDGFFRNGGTACWVSRLCHYSDPTNPLSYTAVAGTQTLLDRGGTAAPAILQSVTEPYALASGDVLLLKIDGDTPNSLTFTASPAQVTTSAGPFTIPSSGTVLYQVKDPQSGTLGPVRTLPLTTGSMTAAQLVAAVAQYGNGINAVVSGSAVVISTNKEGSAATLVITGGTALTALGLTVGTNNGSGNVGDIDAVLSTEVASLLTALPLVPTGATAYAAGGKVTVTGVTTGPGGSIVVQSGTTATTIFAGSLPITVNGTTSAQVPTFTVAGKWPGTYIDAYSVLIRAATSGNPLAFDFVLYLGTSVQEIWPNLTMDTDDTQYFESIINANSQYVTVTDLFDSTTPPNNLPATGTFSNWASANDGLAGLTDADFVGSSAGETNGAGGTGLYSFDTVDILNIITVPGRATSAVHNAMVQYCAVQRVGLTFAILDPPTGMTAQEVDTYFTTTAALLNLDDHFAFYWPNIQILNPNTSVYGVTANGNIIVPPSGHIAGAYARTDQSSPGGVYDAPAGITNGVLFGCLDFETEEVNDERKRDVIYPDRINPICVPGQGAPRSIDGSRTGSSITDFPSIPERRGVMFIEASLKQGLLFVKHQNNDSRLRNEVRNTIDAFLLLQFLAGAFAGDTPAQSFYVDVSDNLNPPEVIFAGQLIARIGLATNKPAEFIILKFTQDTRALDEALATANPPAA